MLEQDYWEAKNKAQSEQRQKVDVKAIPSLSQLYQEGDKKRVEEHAAQSEPRPHTWQGQGMKLPPGSKFAPDTSKLVNGEK